MKAITLMPLYFYSLFLRQLTLHNGTLKRNDTIGEHCYINADEQEFLPAS